MRKVSRFTPACMLSLGACILSAPTAHAGFVFTGGTKHISGSATDFSGTVSFTHTLPVPFGHDVLGDSALTPAGHTEIHSGMESFIGFSLIEGLGGPSGGTMIPGGGPSITGASFIEIHFFIPEPLKYVSWDYHTVIGFFGETASVSLIGPGGVVPIGLSHLPAGGYILTASATFVDIHPPPSVGTFSHYAFRLENVPAPGAAMLLALAGVKPRRKRR